jgi:hypothetical protein
MAGKKEKNSWDYWKGKKVFVEIQIRDNIKRYSATVNEVQYTGKNEYGVEIYFLTMTDKYNFKIGVSSNNINFIKQEL